MSVSISWRPADPDDGISFASGSNLVAALELAFGTFPIELRSNNINTLRGMIACGYGDLEDLITAIHEHTAVTIDTHY